MIEERFIQPEPHKDDAKDSSLRPQSLEAFIGQERVKRNLSVCISAAKKRQESLDHLLLYGPPGLGKTTLSRIVSEEMQVDLKITSGPAIERAGDLAAILSNLSKGDVLFIDEIHRLNRVVEEVLYPAMEDFYLDIVIGKGPAARSIRLDLEPFSLVGATTRVGLLSAPLRDRFGLIERMDYYQPEELKTIICRSAQVLDIGISDEAALILAKRSRGTPRLANRLLKRVRDWAQIKGNGFVDLHIIDEALISVGVDSLGLDDVDRSYLSCIIDRFNGGPVGVETLAASISEDVSTIEDVYEPFLLQKGFIQRTPRGRVATPGAYQHLGFDASHLKDECVQSLFKEGL